MQKLHNFIKNKFLCAACYRIIDQKKLQHIYLFIILHIPSFFRIPSTRIKLGSRKLLMQWKEKKRKFILSLLKYVKKIKFYYLSWFFRRLGWAEIYGFLALGVKSKIGCLENLLPKFWPPNRIIMARIWTRCEIKYVFDGRCVPP